MEKLVNRIEADGWREFLASDPEFFLRHQGQLLATDSTTDNSCLLINELVFHKREVLEVYFLTGTCQFVLS